MVLSRISFVLSVFTLATLVVVRMAAPAQVVGDSLGFILAFVSSAAFFLGLAELRGLGSNHASLGRPLALFSAFFTTLTLDVLLGLNNLLPAAYPRMLLALSPLVIFLGGAWWLALTKPMKELNRLRPLIWLAFAAAAGCVVALVAFWRGPAS